MNTIVDTPDPDPTPDYDALAAEYRLQHGALISQASEVLRHAGSLRSRQDGTR